MIDKPPLPSDGEISRKEIGDLTSLPYGGNCATVLKTIETKRMQTEGLLDDNEKPLIPSIPES